MKQTPITYEHLATAGIVIFMFFVFLSAIFQWVSWLNPKDEPIPYYQFLQYEVGCNFEIRLATTTSLGQLGVVNSLNCSNGQAYQVKN